MGYFIQFHLEVLQKAFSDLRTYLQHQQEQQQQAAHLLHRGGRNPRQAQLLTLFAKNREEMFTVRDLSQRFGITPTTAKAAPSSASKAAAATALSISDNAPSSPPSLPAN